MSKILVLNYSLDPEHLVFAHQHGVVMRLANFYDEVIVIPILDCEVHLKHPRINVFPYNWHPKKRLYNSIRFISFFLRVFKSEKPDVIFSHMTDSAAFLIAPITFLLRVPHHLWYAHATLSIQLFVAKHFLTSVISSTSGSCPVKGSKIHLIGQGVDHTEFPLRQFRPIKRPHKVISVSRLDPSKNTGTLMEFHARYIVEAVPGSCYQVIGSSTSFNEEYELGLKTSLTATDKENGIEFLGKKNREEILSLLLEADLVLHAFKGSLDKSLIEATMVGIPVITLNLEYLNIFGSWSGKFPDGDDLRFLGEEYETIVKMKDSALESVIAKRANRSIANHSLDHWIESLTMILIDSNKASDSRY